MTDRAQRWLVIAGVTGAMAVMLGAFGAHGVPGFLETQGYDSAAVAERLADFNTAARYHMYGALFLLGVALVMGQSAKRSLSVAAWFMLIGVVVFGGAVYAVALVPDAMRPMFGMLAPVGGSAMIAAWVALAVAAIGKRE